MSNRDIIATRKLSENKKARLGRKGDTEIRNVDGKESHVNALEASLIDSYGKAGEDFAKSVGAGTVNPYTGMREYHQDDDHSDDVHSQHGTITTEDEDGNEVVEIDYSQELMSSADLTTDVVTQMFTATNTLEGQQTFEDFSKLSESEQAAYYMDEFGIDAENLKFISSLTDKPFEFLQQQRGLQEQGFGMQDRQLQSDYGFTQRQMESQRADTSADLGQATGQQYQQASQAAMQAASQSGLATSGTIQEGLDQQMKQMFGDYSTGQQRAQRDYTFGMDQAQSTLGFGQEQVQLDRLGADLDLARGSYEEGQRQMDKLYREVGGVIQTQNAAGDDSCFDGETIILMSDGSKKKIKDIKVGEKVIGYTGEINTVTEVEINPLAERNLYGFGGDAWFTREHPFLTSSGWKSLNPEKTLLENTSFKDLTKMQVGDKLFTGFKVGDKIAYVHTSIKELSSKKRSDFHKDKVVYNLLTDGNNTYHANGFVVHTIQPHFDATYVKNGIKNLKDKDREVLFNFISSSENPNKLLEVIGKAWGVSVPKAFRDTMNR